jgi:hypothetical protein
MEQRLDATYLRSGPFERASAIGIAAVAIGTGILLATWGISFLWQHTPSHEAREIVIRQEKPFEIAPPPLLKIDPDTPPLKIEQPAPLPRERDAKTPEGDVIKREVTVFSTVKHGVGYVTTGWNYRNGSGGVPVSQFCYYAASNIDSSTTKIDIASDGARLFNASLSLVPELEEALAKCQWWQG